ncbi:MAG: HAD family hydrolase [Candidatus Methylomirabilales bacterium]
MRGAKYVDLLVFDLDGTLADTRADLTAAVNHALEKLGRAPLSVEEVCRYVGDGVQTLLSRALGPDDLGVLEAGVGFFREYYAVHLLDATCLYQGVRETLEHFQGKRKAIVTNKPLEFTVRILEGLAISGHFDVVLGGDSTVERKPHPEPARRVLSATGVESRLAAMVGDSPVDVEMAKRAGLYSVGVTYGLRPVADLRAAGPDVLIDDFPELRRRLR